MLLEKTRAFELDAKLAADSTALMQLGFCELRVMNDRRWSWLVLVPQRTGASEVHDLTPLEQTMLAFETNLVAEALKRLTGCDKINTGALGNIVRQLHVHVIARFEGDDGWPGPVWGFGERQPYDPVSYEGFARKVRDAL